MNTFAYAFAGFGEPFIGWMIDVNNDNTGLVFSIVAVCCLVGAFISLFIRR